MTNNLQHRFDLKTKLYEDKSGFDILGGWNVFWPSIIAPLTPSAVTPHHEEVINADIEEEDIEFENEDQGW